MKKTLISLLLVAVAGTLSAQNPTGKQVYVEGGGPGVAFSANFDSRFQKGATLGWGYRLGVGFELYDKEHRGSDGYYDWTTRSYPTIPIGLNYVFGKPTSDHAFEVGAGVTLLTHKRVLYTYGGDDDARPGNMIGHFTFMYRRQPVHGGFTWRIGFMPVIGTSGDIVPSAAIGLGYSF